MSATRFAVDHGLFASLTYATFNRQNHAAKQLKSDNISTQHLFQGKLLFLLVWSQQYFYYISRKALQYDT